MWQDPIIEEIHKVRKALAAKFQYDAYALGKFFQAQQETEGHAMVTRASKHVAEVQATPLVSDRA